jgi:hypothetical protein
MNLLTIVSSCEHEKNGMRRSSAVFVSANYGAKLSLHFLEVRVVIRRRSGRAAHQAFKPDRFIAL